MRNKLAALVVLVVCVVAAGWASLALGMRAYEHDLALRARRAMAELRASYELDAKATQRQLQQVCTRDAQLERLSRELSAGGTGEAEASRTVLGLSRVLAADLWLLAEQDGALRALAASSTLPSALPPLDLLRAAESKPQLLAAQPPRWVVSCARKVTADSLWVVRAEPVASAQKRWLTSEASVVAPGGSPDFPHGNAILALWLEGNADELQRAIWLQVVKPPDATLLLAPLPLFAALVALAGVLAYLLLTRSVVDDAVLAELEQAAERVGKGDLTARIGLRPGGRADQTFRTFDRMTEELADMRTKLAEAERAAAWQDMARRIAHEIKNPLSPIQMAIETLRKAHDKQLPVFDEIFEESTRAILEEVRRMEHIVREFSDFARLPRARPGAVEMGALLADTVALYQTPDVRIEVVNQPGPTPLRVDREQITQVLVNLIKNATDAARVAAHPHVRINVASDKDMVRVQVDDNGPGIAAADRERVFEPYYTTKDEGTGLGLAIVKRIVFDHDGSITVDDSVLGGARFTLRLPRKTPP